MAEPYIGEIRLVPYTFNPAGWALCSGQLLSISQNAALFSLIGTTYGGDGVNTFALPNLQSRIPVHMGTSAQGTFIQGQLGGVENVTLTQAQIPSHSHAAQCNSGATQTASNPAGAVWVNSNQNQYTDQATPATMNAGALSNTGGNQPHENRMPFQVINFIIALVGIFPSRS